MKKIGKILGIFLTLTVMITGMKFAVSADTTTDLQSMKVYAINAAGEKSEVPLEFNATTYTYDITVMSDVTDIEVEAEAADANSTCAVDKDGINTKMDVGMNLTQVVVTSSTGATNRYTINTKKLTEQEQETYVAPQGQETETTDKSDAVKDDNDTTVKVGKKEFKIAKSFDKDSIPQGFVKDTQEYNGEEYDCIKGEVKNITAFYLYNDKKEGFYIYDEGKDEFYRMDNIQIKSRMYTIVNPQTEHSSLKNYSKKKIQIGDVEVKAWTLNADEGLYLIYAMNWNGDTNLYCYDQNEECFQRYIIEDDANAQVDAANAAYEGIQKKYNNLVRKYNIILKIMCGLVIIIAVLIFVILNMALRKKEKKIKKSLEENDINSGESDDTEKDSDKKESTDADDESDLSELNEKEEGLYEDIAEPEISGEKPETVDSEDAKQDTTDEISEADEIEVPKHKLFGKKENVDRGYGDEPTFGLENEQTEGFYGGEIEDEDEILIDITDDGTKEIPTDEIEEKTKQLQKKTEEDLRETLKAMLPDEEDSEDDEDFEFIDLD